MIAILKFNLEDEGDRKAHDHMLKAEKYLAALYEISEEVMRKHRKYAEMTDEQREYFEKIDEEINCVLIAYGIEVLE